MKSSESGTEDSHLTSASINRMVRLVREGNRLLREQSYERFQLLKQIAIRTNDYSSEISQLMLGEIDNLHSDSDLILSQLKVLYMSDPKTNRLLELVLGYDLSKEADEPKKDPKIIFGEEIIRQEANIMAREELIEILKEDLELNRASRYRILNEVYQLRQQYNRIRKEINLLEKILFYNPKYKIIEILAQHPYGISISELADMMDKRNDEVEDLLRELERSQYVTSDGYLYKQMVKYPEAPAGYNSVEYNR